MIHHQFKLNVATIFASALLFAACNSSQTSDAIADTAATPAYLSADSSMQMPSDTTSAMQPMDTSKSMAVKSTSVAKHKGKVTVMLEPETKHTTSMDKSGVYDYAEVMPTYPGGQSALDNYVNNSIQYPDNALNDGKEGRVLVAFIVDEDGKVTDVHSTGTKVGEGLDEEAARVVAAMPKWTPGMVKGKPVKAKVTLPITFKIEE